MTDSSGSNQVQASAPQKGQEQPSSAATIHKISFSDLLAALGAGLEDFRRAPAIGLGLAAIYTIGGWLMVLLLISAELYFLVYPLAAGFALVAPFIACGFYAISVCLEKGEPVTWKAVRGLTLQASRRDLGWMALVTGFSFFFWMDIAAILFFGFLGFKSFSFQGFIQEIFTTPSGLLFLVIGNGAGALIALAVFSFSVTSFPMLFERDCSFVTAMITSVQSVVKNPKVMMAWCAIIAALVTLSLLSGLIGLLVVLPVLGHTSWHLYRRTLG